MTSQLQTIAPILAVATFSICSIPGCGLSFEHDEATSVKLIVSGIEGEDARQMVKETLEEMTDRSGHMMTTRIVGDTMTTTLSPVSDVDAFVKKIDFGTVTDVDGRKIKVDYVP